MLLLLLVLVTVSHMTVAQFAPRNLTGPLKWFSEVYLEVFTSSSDDGLKAYICFERVWDESESNLCLWTETTADHKFTKVEGRDGQYDLYMNTSKLSFSFGQRTLAVTSSTNGRAMTVYSQAGPPGTIFEEKAVNGTTIFSIYDCYDGEIALSSEKKACTADGRQVYCPENGNILSSSCKLCKDGECLIKSLCTVTGNQVQNLKGTVVTIPDRCTYDMVINRNLYSVKAFFREHRRKDVSVLDALELTGKATVFLFRQGQVKVNGSVVNLTSPLSLHGANISRTSSGFSFIAEHFRMYFKGDAATIGISSDIVTNYTRGMCLSTNPQKSKDYDLSEDGCSAVLPEKNDTTINCTEIKQHCGLLNSSIFSSCSSIAEVNELMEMCENFLCKYPSVDTARCMFHEALAMTCDLLERPVANWRSQTQCEATAGKCVDTFCAENEFCALENGKETCLCRAVFASRYRPNNTFGEPTVCSKSSGSLSLALCLLKEKNIHYDKLQLIDPKCTGLVDQDKGLLTFSFSSTDMCGTNVTVEKDQVMHKNKVMLSNETSGLITRQDQFELDFSCFYNVPQVQTVGLKIKDSSVMATITAGNWVYNLSMKAYEDEARTTALAPGANITMDQTVWVELRTEGLDQDLVQLVTDSCWATSEAAANSTLKYELVKMGCATATDKSVTVHQNGLGTSNYFSFNTFRFKGAPSSDLYLHCEVSLCVEKKCAPSCNGARRRRSLRKDRSLISMFWAD